MPSPNKRSERIALVAALLLLAAITAAIVACGDDDLFFPGELPATATEVPTSTATPDGG